MEKWSKRIIALLIGICLWIFYIFEKEMAGYGIYTIVSYGTHEIASVIPFLSIAVILGWFICLVIQMMRKKCDKRDKIFTVILACLVLWQGYYIYQTSYVVSTVVVTSIESIDERREIVIKNGDGEKVTLKSPMLVNHMVETTGREYLITYTWHRDKRNEGKLQMISLIEEKK